MTEQVHAAPTAVHAIPAQRLACGFRLLLLREFLTDGEPSSFGYIDQSLMRPPERRVGHGVWFAGAFLPDIVAWLIDELGRPTQHDAAGQPLRNPRWPMQSWRSAQRLWAEGVRTIEWSIEVRFDNAESWARFQRHWGERLRGAREAGE